MIFAKTVFLRLGLCHYCAWYKSGRGDRLKCERKLMDSNDSTRDSKIGPSTVAVKKFARTTMVPRRDEVKRRFAIDFQSL